MVRDRIKFRIGQIVYLAFSRDETVMGFAFPKEERDGLVASEPEKFMLPRPSDMRYNWVHVRLDAIDLVELREIVVEAWRMCVPKSVAAGAWRRSLDPIANVQPLRRHADVDRRRFTFGELRAVQHFSSRLQRGGSLPARVGPSRTARASCKRA